MSRKLIPIDRSHEMLRYDADTGALFWKVLGAGRRRATGAGCIGPLGYLIIGLDGSLYQAHRIIWALHYGEQPPEFMDHINGIRTDNRIANLRAATLKQNNRNRTTRHDNQSGLKGVRQHCRKGPNSWTARIVVDGKVLSLGYYPTPELAAQAYRTAEIEHFGEFARST